jgi:hypothetical protein
LPTIAQAPYEYDHKMDASVFVVTRPKTYRGFEATVVERLPPKRKRSSVPRYRLRGPNGNTCIRSAESVFEDEEAARKLIRKAARAALKAAREA